jgi:hypothetical protein
MTTLLELKSCKRTTGGDKMAQEYIEGPSPEEAISRGKEGRD